jgi:hypothetical protein
MVYQAPELGTTAVDVTVSVMHGVYSAITSLVTVTVC